jgi:hypothetical protein
VTTPRITHPAIAATDLGPIDAALVHLGAELLPDQRWVQLISLTRPGLEVEPMWWDRLRASTIVAPGAAAVEPGLQVARAVVS